MEPTHPHKDALLKKRGEILGSGGIKPLQASMENNTRQGDMADQANGNNGDQIQLKIQHTAPETMQALEIALWRIENGSSRVCPGCRGADSVTRLDLIPVV